MWKKYYKKKGHKKSYKKKKNYNYSNWKIKDSDIWIVIWTIATIVISIVLKIWFWLLVIWIWLFSLYIIYKIFIFNFWDKMKSSLIIIILIFDSTWLIIAFEKQEIVYNKIDNIASDIWGFFWYKKWKIIIDNEAWIEWMMKNDLIENLDNK